MEKEFEEGVSEWKSDLDEADKVISVNNFDALRLKKRIGRRKAINLFLKGCPEGVKWSQSFKHKRQK